MNLTNLKESFTRKLLVLVLPLALLFVAAAPSVQARDHHDRGGRHVSHRSVGRSHYVNRGYYGGRGYRHVYYGERRHHHGYWRRYHGRSYWYEDGGYFVSPGGVSINIGL